MPKACVEIPDGPGRCEIREKASAYSAWLARNSAQRTSESSTASAEFKIGLPTDTAWA